MILGLDLHTTIVNVGSPKSLKYNLFRLFISQTQNKPSFVIVNNLSELAENYIALTTSWS